MCRLGSASARTRSDRLGSRTGRIPGPSPNLTGFTPEVSPPGAQVGSLTVLLPQVPCVYRFTTRAECVAYRNGGAARSRTGLIGFAIRCITALLPRLKGCCRRQSDRTLSGAKKPPARKKGSLMASLLFIFCKIWSGKRVSNSRPQPWQGCALPTELFPQCDEIIAQPVAVFGRTAQGMKSRHFSVLDRRRATARPFDGRLGRHHRQRHRGLVVVW